MSQYNLKFLISLIGSSAVFLMLAPAIAVTMDDFFNAPRNLVNQFAGQADSPSPLPVPNSTPPVGQADPSAAPCLPPPRIANSVTPPAPVTPAAVDNYRDPKTKILMNTRPGNRMVTLLDRVGYPQKWDNKTRTDYFNTEDGTIAVRSDQSDRVVSINFVR